MRGPDNVTEVLLYLHLVSTILHHINVQLLSYLCISTQLSVHFARCHAIAHSITGMANAPAEKLSQVNLKAHKKSSKLPRRIIVIKSKNK